MHFSLATILAASTLLFSSSLAAPLPNNDGGNVHSTSGSCSTDTGSVINVGVGVGVGNSIYKPSNGVKVKQGDQGSCPAGWTRSLLEVDLCIQVGGNDHHHEKQQGRADPTHRAVHAPSPYWGVRSTTTVDNQRATHTSAPQKDEWTPRGGSKKPATTPSPDEHEHEHAHSSSSRSTSSRSSTSSVNKAARPTSSPSSSRCPQGQTPGTGSLLDVCLDIDTDPLYVGGGIKLGGHASPSTSKGRTGSRTSSASPSATPVNDCSDGSTFDAFLGVCIDIDTDPLFVGGGIKIGGSPRPQATSSSSSARNGSPTPRPSPSSRPEYQQGSDNRGTQDGDLPECNGENDPRALLDLCVSVGDLLGARIKLGGSGTPPSSSSGSRSPQSTPYENPNKGHRGDQKNSNKSNEADGSLPPCNGPDDPNAVLNLCVQVGDLLGAGVKIGGSSNPSSTTSSRAANRTPISAKSSPPSEDDNDGNILDLSLGNLLNAKIGSGPRPAPSTSSPAYSPTPTPRKVKQSAPIVTYHDTDSDSSDRSNSEKKDDEQPLVSVSVSAQVELGPSSTSQKAERTTTRPSRPPTPTPQAANSSSKKGCPVGQILNLGICVEAEADVLGLVQADAAATVAV
ncbi:hypothetical protein JCM5350_006304 [Sporobolomyces pararoseus]